MWAVAWGKRGKKSPKNLRGGGRGKSRPRRGDLGKPVFQESEKKNQDGRGLSEGRKRKGGENRGSEPRTPNLGRTRKQKGKKTNLKDGRRTRGRQTAGGERVRVLRSKKRMFTREGTEGKKRWEGDGGLGKRGVEFQNK